MNTAIIDTLTDVSLRSTEALVAAIKARVNAGLPWLTQD